VNVLVKDGVIVGDGVSESELDNDLLFV
jgi:hypothetical protein